MKKVLIAILAVVAFASCANEETLMEAPKQAIEFGDVFVDNATRADYSNGLSLTDIVVCGTVTGVGGATVNIFNNVLVTGTVGGTWTYDSSEAQYWVPGADYDFMAIGDQTAHYSDDTKDANGMPTRLQTLINTATNLADMLYATAHVENATANQGAVNFTFNHLLSKAKFTVTSNAQGDYYHTVKDIKVANYGDGTYYIQAVGDIAAGTWVGNPDETKDVPFGDIAQVTSAGAKSNDEMLLVPVTADFNVAFTVETWYTKGTVDTADDVKVGTEPKTIPVDTDLVKGNAYNFTITCSMGNPIQFSVTNNPTGWGDGGSVNIQ